jgi:hypothetical protein
VGAEALAARRFRKVDADAGLEPLAVPVYQGDCRHGHTEDVLHQARDTVEWRLWRGVQNLQCMQGADARVFGERFDGRHAVKALIG